MKPALKVTYGNDNTGWVVFDANHRDAHPNRIIWPLFASGAALGANAAHAWLSRQELGPPEGKLTATRPEGYPKRRGRKGRWFIRDAAGRCYTCADTKAEARDCMRIINTNPPAETPDEGYFAYGSAGRGA
jgi:hypothetical protein